jgi:hypothetical protein
MQMKNKILSDAYLYAMLCIITYINVLCIEKNFDWNVTVADMFPDSMCEQMRESVNSSLR